MPWWGWTLIILVVVSFALATVGHWLQAKGRSVERNRD